MHQSAQIRSPVRSQIRFGFTRILTLQSFYLKPVPSILMGGVLPFGAIFIELFFILNSMWNHRIYYVFGFLFLVFGVLILTCSSVTILLCYFHLCSEDYRWWWRSFLTSGSCALYVFVYSIMVCFSTSFPYNQFYITRLDISSFSATVLYFGWTFIVSFLFFILTGSIGFFTCLKFVRKIYSSIKID